MYCTMTLAITLLATCTLCNIFVLCTNNLCKSLQKTSPNSLNLNISTMRLYRPLPRVGSVERQIAFLSLLDCLEFPLLVKRLKSLRSVIFFPLLTGVLSGILVPRPISEVMSLCKIFSLSFRLVIACGSPQMFWCY